MVSLPGRVAPEKFGPFTLFLEKSRRVAPGNFWGICLASVKFSHLATEVAPLIWLFGLPSPTRRPTPARLSLCRAVQTARGPVHKKGMELE